MLAKHIDDDMPSFFIVDIDDESRNGVVRQGHKRRPNGFLLWLWFLSSRAWTWHICKHGEVRCVVVVGSDKDRVPPLSGFQEKVIG